MLFLGLASQRWGPARPDLRAPLQRVLSSQGPLSCLLNSPCQPKDKPLPSRTHILPCNLR